MVGCVLAQRSDRRADLGSEEIRLFPRCEVTAPVDLVERNEPVLTTLGPALWRTANLAGKDRHGSGDRDVHGIEVGGVILPLEPRGRDRAVRGPAEGHVVERLISKWVMARARRRYSSMGRNCHTSRQPGRQANPTVRSPRFAGGSPSWRRSRCSSRRRCQVHRTRPSPRRPLVFPATALPARSTSPIQGPVHRASKMRVTASGLSSTMIFRIGGLPFALLRLASSMPRLARGWRGLGIGTQSRG